MASRSTFQQISLRLSTRLLQDLDRRALKGRVSRSDLIRELIEQALHGPGTRVPDHPYTRIRDLLGALSGGPPDLGARHREHLAKAIRDRRG